MRRIEGWRRIGMGLVVLAGVGRGVVAQEMPVLPALPVLPAIPEVSVLPEVSAVPEVPTASPAAMQAQMLADAQVTMAEQQARMAGLQAEAQAKVAEARARMAADGPEMQAEMAAVRAEAPAMRAEARAMVAAAMRAHGAEMLAEVGPGPLAGLGLEPPSGGQDTGGKGARAEISTKDDLFAGTEKFAKSAKEATEVNMAPDELDDVRGAHASRARGTVLNVVHSYEFERPGMYSMSDVDEFRRKLDGPGWHCTVRTRDLKSGGSTDVCNKRRTDGLRESAIITVEPKELTFIHRIERGNEMELHRDDSD